MLEVPSRPDLAVVVGDFPGLSPIAIFEHFVRPGLVVMWWPTSATIDARVGGRYELIWPEQDWNLSGEYTAVEPGKHLGFTWKWAHEPDAEPQQVDLYIHPLQDGARLAVFHGPFGVDEAGQMDRQGVVEGWIHFGMRLAGLTPTSDQPV